MLKTTPTCEEIACLGQEHYDLFLRNRLEPEHTGEYLVLEVESGGYEMDRDERLAFERARNRWPSGVFYVVRVDYRTAAHIGAKYN